MMKNFSTWFDELNNIVSYMYANNKENINDVVETLLIDAFQRGWDDVEDMLDYELVFDVPVQAVRESIDRVIAGKTTNDRVNEYKGDETAIKELQNVVANECQRIYNEAANYAAHMIQEDSGLIITKTWRTMNDLRVRDSHDYLEGMTVRLDERFYTWNGDSTDYPRGFGIPDEDVNCRCWVEYGTEN